MAGVIERYPELGFTFFRPYTTPWPYGEYFTVSRRHRGLFSQTVGILVVGER